MKPMSMAMAAHYGAVSGAALASRDLLDTLDRSGVLALATKSAELDDYIDSDRKRGVYVGAYRGAYWGCRSVRKPGNMAAAAADRKIDE
jgi:hypothetical protein